MILKVLTRHSPSYASLIRYITEESKAPDGQPLIVTQNLRGKGEAAWTKEYLENEASRAYTRKNQVYLYHEILSFSNKEDKSAISREMLEDMANQYMRLRGKEGVMLGAVHTDKEHVHFHFCTSGTKYRTGKANRLSRQELQELKVKFQDYHKEQYPELTESTCDHGRGKDYVTDREWQARHKAKRSLLKDEIREKVLACYSQATSQKEFLSLLQAEGLYHYERNGQPAGITYENMKIRFSRLDIQKDWQQALSPGNTVEKKALEEIERIRGNAKGREKTVPTHQEAREKKGDDSRSSIIGSMAQHLAVSLNQKILDGPPIDSPVHGYKEELEKLAKEERHIALAGLTLLTKMFRHEDQEDREL